MPTQNPAETLILASASPRRVELLQQLGLKVFAQAADVDESVLPNECPKDYVRRVAALKVAAIGARYPNAIVIGADTTVVGPAGILGKPSEPAEAVRMLTQLSGRQHEVWTGVCVGMAGDYRHAEVKSSVVFRDMDAKEIEAYVSSGEPMDKAGAYGIQGLGAMFVQHLEGSYSAVMGLPLCETAKLLADIGYHPLLNSRTRLNSQS